MCSRVARVCGTWSNTSRVREAGNSGIDLFVLCVSACVARALARRFEADLRVVSPAFRAALAAPRAGRFFALRLTLLRVLVDVLVVRLAAERLPAVLPLVVIP